MWLHQGINATSCFLRGTGTVASLERPCPSSSAMWPRADVVKKFGFQGWALASTAYAVHRPTSEVWALPDWNVLIFMSSSCYWTVHVCADTTFHLLSVSGRLTRAFQCKSSRRRKKNRLEEHFPQNEPHYDISEGGCCTKHPEIAAYLASCSWCKNGTAPNSEQCYALTCKGDGLGDSRKQKQPVLREKLKVMIWCKPPRNRLTTTGTTWPPLQLISTHWMSNTGTRRRHKKLPLVIHGKLSCLPTTTKLLWSYKAIFKHTIPRKQQNGATWFLYMLPFIICSYEKSTFPFVQMAIALPDTVCKAVQKVGRRSSTSAQHSTAGAAATVHKDTLWGLMFPSRTFNEERSQQTVQRAGNTSAAAFIGTEESTEPTLVQAFVIKASSCCWRKRIHWKKFKTSFEAANSYQLIF